MNEDESLELLEQATDAAIQLLQQTAVLQLVKNENELLLFFDCLMQDYIFVEMGLDVEQFKAVVFKNFLLH